MAQKNGNGVRHPPRGRIHEEPPRALTAPSTASWERGALLHADRYTEMHAAFHRNLGREVAVLRLRPEYAQDEVLRERLRRAAEVLRRVRHPSVIRLHEYAAGSEAEGPCLLLERIQGPTLEALSKDRGPLPAPLVLSIGRILGRALKAVHDHGVIHRDVHPGHLLLDRERGRLVLTGFLFALPALTDDAQELTRDWEAVGTPDYMAPEQARGEGVDEHVDVFALGVLLYELLTGRRPFAGDTLEAYLTSVARQD
jgi:serine/threonine-protein kinase